MSEDEDDAQMALSNHLIVVAASRVPPVTGQSLATEMLLRGLERERILFQSVDIGRRFHRGWPLASYIRRGVDVAALPFEVARATRGVPARAAPIFYLQLGQSVQAMARDLPLLSLAQVQRWPTVLHVHGGSFRHAFERAPVPLREASRYLVSRASRIVVLAERLRDMFDGVADPNRVVVVANGVEEGVIDGASRLRRPRSTSDFTVLFLSNLMERKGYMEVLSAARMAEASGRPYRFILAGAETETTRTHPDEFLKAHGLHNVTYVGEVDLQAKVDLFAQSDVLVLPSAYLEGVPLVVLEAMHYGLALVVSDSGGTGDVVRNGVNGLIVPPRDPRALLDALDQLAHDRSKRDTMRRLNIAEARARYTEAAHVQSMLEVFAQVAAEAAAQPER